MPNGNILEHAGQRVRTIADTAGASVDDPESVALGLDGGEDAANGDIPRLYGKADSGSLGKPMRWPAE